MASTATEQLPAQTGREASGRRGAPRGRRGGDGASRGRGGGRGRGRGEGRGDRGDRADRHPRGAPAGNRVHDDKQRPEPQNRAPRVLPVSDSPALQTKPDADDAASDDSDVCFICADPIKYHSIAPCNHVTCHICSLRMRALYKTKACAHCRTESEFVIFSGHESKRFEEFKDSEIVAEVPSLGVRYDDQTIYEDTTVLLRYNCPDADCDRACMGWSDLQRHTRAEHNRVMCDLCIRHKKVFSHEHTLFTPQELRKHERTGDDQPGSENQSGFRGHPECGFCNQRFYSADELYEHCRKSHERCFICDRRNPGANQQYYIDYNALEVHFQKEHYVCQDEECLEQKFVVFDNEVDLKAHQLEKHPNGLSKSARREARRIDMSHFDDARPFQQARDRGRRGRGRGDGGRGQQEAPEQPIRTEQQMSRAEIAYHRQMAVQSAQSNATRAFGGQLTDPAFARPPANAPRPAQVEAPPPRPPPLPAGGTAQQTRVVPGNTAAFPPLAAPLAAPRPTTTTPSPQPGPARSARPPPSSSPQPLAATNNKPSQSDEARKLRHAAVIERAGNMLRQDQAKMDIFRANISKFRSSSISGGELIDVFWALFDVSAAALGKLLHELAELYEDESKKTELLRNWNSWKAINEDYPPIAGASSASTASTGSRVLKIKSSTQRSSRSSTARQGAWGTAAQAAPSAPQPANQNPNRVGKGAHSPTPWVTTATAATPSAAGRNTPVARKDDFPSLPPKKTTPGWTPVAKKETGWEAPAPASSAWAAGGGEGSGDATSPNEPEDGPVNGGGRKKGKQKQILFRVGL